MREEENTSYNPQGKREAKEVDKVEFAPGATVSSLRRFRAAIEKPENPESSVLYMLPCLWVQMRDSIDPGYRMARGWRHTKLSLA